MHSEAAATPYSGPGPLCARVSELCRAVGFRESHLNHQLESLIPPLEAPLRVAFAGRVSAGKSTLVNALLGASVAPTGAAETTRIVTKFESGDYEEVELCLRDTSTRQAFLAPDGRLPDVFPVRTEEVQLVSVRLPYSPLLQRVTLIDTPGLESLNEEASGRTVESLFSRDSRNAIAQADALVYLLRTDSQNDAAAVEAFTELATTDFCALNTLGVLNCKTEFSLDDQSRIAQRLRNDQAFNTRLTDVIPIVGLLAFAVRSGAITDRDAAHLRILASQDISELLIDVDEFLEARSEVDLSDRQRLLDLIGFNGLGIALRAIQSTAGDLAAINTALLAASGLPRLLEVLENTFARCADQIKAGQTLASVMRLSYQADGEDGHRARMMIETLRAEPTMHSIQELWALQQCARPDVECPDWLAAGLLRMSAGATFAAKVGLDADASAKKVAMAARDGAAVAHSFAAGLSITRPESLIAETLRRSYTNIYRTVTHGS